MKANRATILSAADAGVSVADIAKAEGVTPGRIYAVLREHRPKRPRKARRRTTDMPFRVRGMLGKGMAASRVAQLLQITRAYVYRIRGES